MLKEPLTFINYPVSPDVTCQYDPLNRLTNMVDAVGTTKYTYISGGELFTRDGPFASDTVTNVYNNRLRTGLKLQQPTGVWTNGFGYDAAKRMTSVTSPAGTFGYIYDASRLRLPVNLSLPNSSFITNRYDVNARLLSTRLITSGASVLDAADYGYNVGNQRTTFTNATGTNVNYLYDPIGQLKVADSAVNSEDRGYLYDAAWNLNRRTNGPTATFSVDGKNQLTSVNNDTYKYDGNGNLTNRVIFHSGTNSFGYDDENQLTSVTTGTGTNPPYTAFVYDGLGRLREQLSYVWYGGTGGGGASAMMGGAMAQSSRGGGSGSGYQLNGGTLYVYDGKRVIQERDTNNTPTVAYTRGNDLSGSLEGAGGIGGLLARSESYSGGNFTSHAFYHADGNGNITYLEDGSETLAASYRYDPYGNLINSSGPLAADNTYRFSSKEWMPSVNGYYYLHRFYRPDLQRWPNRDPIQELGGLNLYRYADNDPIDLIDTDGRLVVHVWSPQGGGSEGGWYGHASVTLDDGTYISYWPSRPIDPPFDSTPARPADYSQDYEGENGRTPTDYYIEGLDENKIKDWWQSCPHGNFSTLNNCSTITCQALQQGGLQLPGHIIHDPGQVANDLNNLWPHFPNPTSGIGVNSIPVVPIGSP